MVLQCRGRISAVPVSQFDRFDRNKKQYEVIQTAVPMKAESKAWKLERG